jgi:hypothetical protein
VRVINSLFITDVEANLDELVFKLLSVLVLCRVRSPAPSTHAARCFSHNLHWLASLSRPAWSRKQYGCRPARVGEDAASWPQLPPFCAAYIVRKLWNELLGRKSKKRMTGSFVWTTNWKLHLPYVNKAALCLFCYSPL